MSFMAQDSRIAVTKTVQEQLDGTTNIEQIKEIMKTAAIDQGLAKREWDESIVSEIPSAAVQPRGHAKTVTINGTKHVLEAATETELAATETALYRKLFAGQPASATDKTTDTPARDAATGRFTTAQATDEEKAALTLQFQLGQIDAATYIEKTGAVGDYLAKQGVPLEDLKEQVQERRTESFQKSWASATEEFLNSSAGSSWPGGDQNREILGKIIVERGLTDTKDKVAALAQAFEFARKNGLLVANPDAEAHRRIQNATTVQEIRDAMGRDSGMFGR